MKSIMRTVGHVEDAVASEARARFPEHDTPDQLALPAYSSAPRVSGEERGTATRSPFIFLHGIGILTVCEYDLE